MSSLLYYIQHKAQILCLEADVEFLSEFGMGGNLDSRVIILSGVSCLQRVLQFSKKSLVAVAMIRHRSEGGGFWEEALAFPRHAPGIPPSNVQTSPRKCVIALQFS